MLSLIYLIHTILSILIWLLIASAVLSWLVAFNVINTHNRVVYMIGDFLSRVTEPMLRPIRSVIPNLGGIDISPIVLILLLHFAQNLLFEYGPRALL
jgi:YggT family protein